jgi:stearoyl-CoA desaturase (delta-9 desaturase)
MSGKATDGLPQGMVARPRAQQLSFLVLLSISACWLIPAGYQLAIGRVSHVDLALLATFYVLTTLGVTFGYHRMLAHDAFKAHPALRAVLFALGGMNVQGGPSCFAAYHVHHHAHSDRPGDTQSPQDGIWHAHCGWFIKMAPAARLRERFRRDPMVVFFDETELLWAVVGLVLPFGLGGLLGGESPWSWRAAASGFLWGGTLRLFLAQNALWLGGWVGHFFGTREFETPDQSRNSWLIALLLIGDGWHNNHHRMPASVNCSAHFWQPDPQALLARALAAVGLVRNARWATAEDWARQPRVAHSIDAAQSNELA